MNPISSDQAGRPRGREAFLYYTLGLTPSVEHADWVRRDVASTAWQVRRALQGTAGLILGVLIAAALVGLRPGLMAGSIIGAIIAFGIQVLFMGDYVRRRTMSYYERRWSKQRSD